MTQPSYDYNAKLIRVVDGDTVWVDIDLGFRTRREEILRLYGINAPEIVGSEKPKGLVTKTRLETLLPTQQSFTIKTFKNPTDKYGRWLAELYVDGVNINQQLIAEGLAEVM